MTTNQNENQESAIIQGRQWSGITKEIWDRGEKIDEEWMQATYERLMKKNQKEEE